MTLQPPTLFTANDEYACKPVVFDAAKSEAAKVRGMKRAAVNKREGLDVARAIARRLGANGATVNADDVAKAMVEQRPDLPRLGNAAGSIFQTGEWVQVGLTKSVRRNAHRNLLRQWRLRGAK